MAVSVGARVGGFVDVAVGIGVSVGGTDVRVGGTEVEAGAHPLNKTVRNTNARKTNPIDFFMTFSPFDLIMQGTAQRDCRKTPGSKNVQKNLPQQAKKMPKYSQNVVRNTKTRCFSAFLSHFPKIIFEK